jgi:hypothetical protein
MNTISARITPRSKAKAALNPLMAAVSNKTKKAGPTMKAKKKPRGIPESISCNIKNYSILNQS